MVGKPHSRTAKLMDEIHRQFMDGAGVARLARKHSLPARQVEFILRLKALGHQRRIQS